MSRILWIALAGAAGTLARYGVGAAIGRRSDGFPVATLLVNLVGCLALGFLVGLFTHRLQVADDVRIGLTVGFLGAFTTFSTFGLESVRLISDGASVMAGVYVAASVLGGLTAAWAGLATGSRI